ncbi:hypothetical protein [Helicobacter sp. NHP22-001]|uniref:hypothetical protein n=1 Tax=Helicobacter sp. NHP22-001 TaxID=3040202 RepID=UPI00244D84BD|nr:hypothetical protein [Helicobacter sp. NHP22-001]GMB96779.1 hypothetical protein NHP22001_13680 [Helicobacter sp. NHP22-001]
MVDGIQPAKDGYEILVKYYREGKEFQAKSAVLANKETFLTAMTKGGYQIVESQAQQLHTPKQPQATSSNNDLTEYIGRNLYMNNNGISASLKITDIAHIENGKVRVDIKDIDKPRKTLNPFILDNVKHFKSWFKKYKE